MKIKNIQEYRSFYKKIRRAATELEEHFIGNYYDDENSDERKDGWFTLYHGDKEGYSKDENGVSQPQAGIEGFLQSFLDMAKDGQAVYEFLQNAADAESTHFTMVWGQDEIDGNHYLLVANNGKMFDYDSVRSILNIGSSTKSSDSQTIGKFGIGFKLAHRLVGKSNGLDELIYGNSGPILFSWKNYEIEKLSNNIKPIPETINWVKKNKVDYTIVDENPWLFKILITCFPCLPENDLIEDLPRMANGQIAITPPFCISEYEVLSRWVKKNQGILNKDIYTAGSLFFIKLGVGKESDLEELNLKAGVKFALAILRETVEEKSKIGKLHTVQLNAEEPITLPDLKYIRFNVDKEKERNTYAYIRFGITEYTELTPEQKNKIEKEATIEILFGFKKHNEIGDYFKDAPNLYLYFPLSEEVHNFNYILHSNAFYKGTSRTFLHEGGTKEDGINERLLKTIVKKIDETLSVLSTSLDETERTLFLDFYAALLTSGTSQITERKWIEEPYINPIKELLKKYIPIRKSVDSDEFEVLSNPAHVYNRKTSANIDTTVWQIENVNWFYWEDRDGTKMQENASDKLSVKNYSAYDLLNEAEEVCTHLNNWLDRSENNLVNFLSEISALPTGTEKALNSQLFRDNLFKLKLLKFTNGEVLTVNEFLKKEDTGYFIIHNKLQEITDLFNKLGLLYTINALQLENFIESYRSNFPNSSYHRGYTTLVQLFSKTVKDEKILCLNRNEKLRIFNAFSDLKKDDKIERIKELKLFCNNNNVPAYFKNLLVSSRFAWLQQFCINASENDPQLKIYLLGDSEDIYEGVICRFWKEIIEYINQKTKENSEIFADIISAYQLSKWAEKNKNYLSDSNLIIFQGEVIESQSIYYNSDLLNEKDPQSYSIIQTTVLKYFGCHIPDSEFASHIDKAPFSYNPCKIPIQINSTKVSEQDIEIILKFCRIVNVDFLGSNKIISTEEGFSIDSSVNKIQIATNTKGIIEYINAYYSDMFLLLPEQFFDFAEMVELHGIYLIEHLISIFVEDDNLEQELDLVNIVLPEGTKYNKLILKKLTTTILDSTWENERQNELYLKLLKDIANASDKIEIEAIHKQILIRKNDQEKIAIGDIDSANDTINVKRGDTDISLSQSQILNLPDAGSIKLITEFHDESLKRGLLTSPEADKLFKISNAGITDELVMKFNKSLTNSQLVNTDQLIFVLLSGKFLKGDIKKYKLKFHDEKWNDFKLQLVIYSGQNENFIKPSYLIHKSYENLQSRLRLNDLEWISYDEPEESIILPHFLFIKGCNPVIIETKEPTIPVIDYLYNGWGNLQSKVSKKSADWKSVLKIAPSNYIICQPCLQSEVLPDDFYQWYDKEDKKGEFLKAIGVQFKGSEIVSLRNWLLSGDSNIPEAIDLKNMNDTLLLNTLYGLCGDFENLNNQPKLFDKSKHEEQITFIEKIIKHLIDKSLKGIPSLIHHTNQTYKLIKLTDKCYRINQVCHEKLQLDPNNNLNSLFNTYNIVKAAQILNEYNQTTFKEIDLLEEYIIVKNKVEHDEPFYLSWKNNCGISLFKVEVISFETSFLANNCQVNIGEITKGDYQILDNGKTIHYLKNISLEELTEKIKEKSVEIGNALAELVIKKDILLKSIYNTLNTEGKDEVNNIHLDALKAAFKEENLLQERKALITNIQDNTTYSYQWFESYLKYLLTFGNKQDTTKQQSLTFQKIERYKINDEISDKFFLLCGCGSIIPLNIQDYEDFKIKLVIKNAKNEPIIVEGAQKKGQDLLVYCREPIRPAIIEKFKDIVQIRISFTPVFDLLEKLYKAFVNRSNIDEWNDITNTLPRLHFIYGPPGTGKTTSLCSIIIEAIKHKYNTNVLFLTPTNKASDVLCKKILMRSQDPDDLITQQLGELDKMGLSVTIKRLGKPTDPELEKLDRDLYKDSLTKDDLLNSNLIASTIHRIPYYDVYDKNEDENITLFKFENHWDYIIFDESSMTSLPYIVFTILALHKTNPNAKFIIAGDPKQIPPVIDINDKELEELEIQDENIYKMLGIISFNPNEQLLRNGDTIQNLEKQYRSIKKIGQLFSELSYNRKLRHHRDEMNIEAKPLPEEFKKIISDNVTFLDIPIDRENSTFKINKLLYSPYHTYSAILVAEIVKYFDGLLKEKDFWSVGLITPYKAQAILLNKLITSYGISEKLKVYADTVHGFQGDECDIVFFIANPNNYEYTGHPKCLLSKEYIYNVAISRAKDYLIILHPFNAIKGNVFVNKLRAVYSNNFVPPIIKEASEIESVLFQQTNYIDKNSYFTGHDNINVFGQTDMRYFIKSNDGAIDIQLRQNALFSPLLFDAIE